MPAIQNALKRTASPGSFERIHHPAARSGKLGLALSLRRRTHKGYSYLATFAPLREKTRDFIRRLSAQILCYTENW
jgi:hypothetical protein